MIPSSKKSVKLSTMSFEIRKIKTSSPSKRETHQKCKSVDDVGSLKAPHLGTDCTESHSRRPIDNWHCHKKSITITRLLTFAKCRQALTQRAAILVHRREKMLASASLCKDCFTRKQEALLKVKVVLLILTKELIVARIPTNFWSNWKGLSKIAIDTPNRCKSSQPILIWE